MNTNFSSAILIAGIALLSMTLPNQAGHAANPDPIDMALDKCLSSTDGQTTVGIVECTAIAIGAWDRRLNQTYQKAMATLDPQSRELLRTSQRQWLAFRQAEHAFNGWPVAAERRHARASNDGKCGARLYQRARSGTAGVPGIDSHL